MIFSQIGDWLTTLNEGKKADKDDKKPFKSIYRRPELLRQPQQAGETI